MPTFNDLSKEDKILSFENALKFWFTIEGKRTDGENLNKLLTSFYDNTVEDETSSLLTQLNELRKENERLRELDELREQYNLFLTHHYRVLFELAHIHGYKISEEDVQKGEEMRNKIYELWQALNPIKE